MNILQNIGYRAIVNLSASGRLGIFIAVVISRLFSPPWQARVVLAQIRFVGARSLLVIVTAGTFVGMVVALQFYDTLVRFGSVSLMGSAVGLSLIRELGPVLTALIVIGRAGSATCAEIGIMRNDNQIDALECMAIDPYRYLLAPKAIAFLLCVPMLTAIFIGVGVIGGWFVGVMIFDINQSAYFNSMADSVLNGDVSMGLTKSLVFGIIIVWICTGKAFLMHQRETPLFGAEGVSQITTEAVVMASIVVLFADYVVSALML